MIIYRKVLILFVSAYAGTFGKITQGLIFFLIIMVSLYCTIKYRPYTRKTYLNLESFSLMVTLLTIYFGIFFISDATQFEEEDYRTTTYGWTGSSPARMFFFIVIVIANALFLCRYPLG